MIFLNALFGYLCFLIVLKWVTGSEADLYHIMIYMFLSPMEIDCGGKCTANLMFPGQTWIQVRPKAYSSSRSISAGARELDCMWRNTN